ncbi:MAG TPA: FAD-dependent monooxygenase [Actinomycetes bacterium]|jgi:2-polyprenyl-6-methoxyphenol hydroxylase-like FAD-dependent oxidoreductase|nr:FAD-dependent monooxygenase [Actinomycetes bacterium]
MSSEQTEAIAHPALVDVLIVGAGPTGLALAALLRALGTTVRIIDRQADPVHESRALAIQPRTLEILAGLGISHSLLESGNKAVQMRLHFGKRVVAARLFDLGVEDTAYPFLLFLSQAETERVLNQHLADRGVTVERGVELTGYTTEADHLICTLRHAGDGHPEQVRVGYMVGCDGARSSVRHLAGIGFAGGAYPQAFVLGDLEADGGLEPGAVHVYLGADGMLFFFPLGGPATWRLLGMRPPENANGPDHEQWEQAKVSLEELQAVTDSYTGGKIRLRDPIWLTSFQLHHRQATRYRAGQVFLAGDAAHVHSPAGAQGMNTGIQDAWNLGWKLAMVTRGVADPSLLDTYHLERWPIGRLVLRFTDRAFTIATSTNPFVGLLRRRIAPLLAPLVLRWGRGRALGFRTISQLGVRYRRSPAVQEGRPALRHGPRAGDRLPDALVMQSGRLCWLSEALAAPVFHLLLCGPPDGWDAHQLTAIRVRYPDLVHIHRVSPHQAPDALIDHGFALARLGVRDAAQYLVRPDGHVGYRCAGTDLHDASGYLARWLGSTTPTSTTHSEE